MLIALPWLEFSYLCKNSFMKNLLFATLLLLLFSSCASISSFQTARTTPKDEGEFGVSLDIAGVSGTFDSNESFAVPNLSLWGRYGVGTKTDIGLKFNTSLNVLFDLKQQIVGDQSSKFALALGGGIGAFPIGKIYLQYHIPLYLSFHPRENFAWYLTPKYSNMFNVGYAGSSIGLLFGKNTKFGMDVSYFGSIGDGIDNDDIDLGTGLFNIGFGVKVPIR